jgi:hypothetical protein
MQIKYHINIFDFDETLFRVPNYSTREAAGLTPYQWYDSKESLASDLPIRGIENTITEARNESSVNYLVTHRVAGVSDEVVDWCANLGLVFKSMFFLGRGTSKYETIIDLLRADPNIRSITIYEDSLNQVIEYVHGLRFLQKSKDLTIDFVYVDTNKVINLRWGTAVMIADTSKITKLTIL